MSLASVLLSVKWGQGIPIQDTTLSRMPRWIMSVTACLRMCRCGACEGKEQTRWCAWHGLLGLPGHFSKLLLFPADSFLITLESGSLFTAVRRFGAVTLVSRSVKGRGR